MDKKEKPPLHQKNRPKMDDVLIELKQKLVELEELKKKLAKESNQKISVQKTKQMLEEIVVPPLEMLKEPKKKKS